MSTYAEAQLTQLEIGERLVAPWSKSVDQPEPDRVDVVLAAEDLLTAVSTLLDARWGYLAAITGLDGEMTFAM